MSRVMTESPGHPLRWPAALATALIAVFLVVGGAEADPGDPDDVTFAEDVAPILQENCQVCHQPGQIGPMSFMSYEEVRPWAPMIKDLVTRREMPPYHYDTDIGIQQLKGDKRLSEEDIQTIVEWVDAGAPLGDPTALPDPVEWPDMSEWRLAGEFGPPDHVIPSAPYTVPANGQDLWWEPVVPTGINEDRCIKAIETKPSVPAMGSTHHANSRFLVQNEAGEWEDFDRLSEFARGKLGEIVPQDACRTAPANSRVSWSIHYYPDGNQVHDDQVEVGIWYHDEDFDEEASYPQDLRSYRLQGGDYDIPPHGKLMTQGFHSFDHPVRLDSFQPHLHLRGVAMGLEVFDSKSGEREWISMISNWNAGWNLSHIYEEGYQPLIPAGAVLILTAWYDNSANNPHNPDPDQWVAAGQRTTDEMSHAWIAVTHLDQEGYERLLAERETEQPVAMTGGAR